MAAVIEVKYFNTFLLKKVNKEVLNYAIIPVWNGSMGIPQAKGGFERPGNNVENDWVIEESRINGGYNNTSVSFGAKAYLVEEEPNGTRRGNSLIYSGIFNSTTGINNTNVFSIAEDIVKSASPANGSIQKLHAENSNLTIFQELKISRALINKDAIYSAEGRGTITNANLVIGTIQPYVGKFGISKDPTSFASYGQNKYFSDRNNNVILRLSQSGLDEISKSNMVDYFRDTLGGLTVAGVEGKIIGGYDIYNKQYVVSTQEPNNDVIAPIENAGYDTLAYDEQVKGWTSFFSYKPDQMFSLGNQFYSLNSGKLYQHYSQTGIRNVFYSTAPVATSITFIFNPAVTSSKNFKTVSYEGTSGWQINSFVSDTTGRNLNFSNSNWINNEDTSALIYSYVEGRYDSTLPNPLTGTAVAVRPFYQAGFDRKENLYVSNLINTSVAGPGEVGNIQLNAAGVSFNAMSGIKGFYATVTISTDTATNPGGEKELFAVSTEYVANNGY